MKVVILCGGKGTRLREETEYRPKPMVSIGNRPILWHIMKTYAAHGHKDFILCLGYKGESIREYFRNYQWNTCDATLTLGRDSAVKFHGHHGEEDWRITLADTGENSMTAWRVKLISKYIGNDENFLLTYGDGVGNINIPASIEQHLQSKKVCTLTAAHPPGRFGELGLRTDGTVLGFNEKPQAEGGYINAGYMVCSRKLFDYLPDDPTVMLETVPMKALVADAALGAYRHEGFWQPMDTFSEYTMLNKLWAENKAPWKIW
jgi:glucose-1-phosphate cytidylyltransferase